MVILIVTLSKLASLSDEVKALKQTQLADELSMKTAKRLVNILIHEDKYWISDSGEKLILSLGQQGNFYEAKAACAKAGGRLVQELTLKNEKAMARRFSHEKLAGNARYGKGAISFRKEYKYERIWLGLRARPGNGTFLWIDSQREPAEPRWAEGYPKLTEGADACAYQLLRGSGRWPESEWFDDNCSRFTDALVVCELDIKW